MGSRTARMGGRSVTALLLALAMALMAVAPFAGPASAQDASPEAEAPTGIAAMGLPQILVRATDTAYAVVLAPPYAEGWTQITLQNETATPATVNLVKLGEGQTAGDISSAVFAAFQGQGGTLPDWWQSAEFAGGAWAAAGGTSTSAVYLTPGRYVVFSSNLFSPQPVQTFAVATEQELVDLYGIVPEATPVGGEASPEAVAEGLASDGAVSITDGAFTGADAPVSGPQVWAVTNDSSEVSELVVAFVAYEIPLEEATLWVGTVAAGDIGSGVVQNATGLISPGTTVYLDLDLAPGTYVLFSAAPAAAGGLQSDGGLVQVIQVP
ncbi:MAG TPA: hypothetical protein VD767_07975 [Thermomicrobiales bacterium]|nr:hypothetical protein [Thermomicrobiales bacterium]